MILSEEEARKRWCPFARVANEGGESESYNRLYTNDAGDADEDHRDASVFSSPCIASACMAWNWEPEAPRKGQDASWLKERIVWDLIYEGSGLPKPKFLGFVNKRFDEFGRRVFAVAQRHPDSGDDNYNTPKARDWVNWIRSVGQSNAEAAIYAAFIKAGVETSVSIGRGSAYEGSVAITVIRAVEPHTEPRRGYCGLSGRPRSRGPL